MSAVNAPVIDCGADTTAPNVILSCERAVVMRIHRSILTVL